MAFQYEAEIGAQDHLARPRPSGTNPPSATNPVAPLAAGLIRHLFDGVVPARITFWDGSALGPVDPDAPGLVIRSPQALTRLLWAPSELGIARSYIAGDIDVQGNLYELLDRLGRLIRRQIGPAMITRSIWFAVRVGALGLPPRRPAEEARLRGLLHSRRRDAAAVTHHYDVGTEFYRLVLGPTMTYSCARFAHPECSLEEAQQAKHDLVCRKLGLHERPRSRLLDVGCGWGSMAIHAAATYGADVVAVTLSPSQADTARERVRAAGVEHYVDVRLQDYRDLRGEQFDAISSIGMFEHVGSKQMATYFSTLFAILGPGGRLLNHAIATSGGSRMRGATFMNRYVFPDGELVDVADVARAMEREGFEVRDVESLREHYDETLRAWIDNLDRSWDEAVALVGERRARIWRLYMTASANGFRRGKLNVNQVLGVRSDSGASGMARTRADWDGTRGAFSDN